MMNFLKTVAVTAAILFGFAAIALAGPKPAKEAKKGQTLEATVKSIDAAKSSITVSAKDGEQTYAVSKDAKVMIKGKEAGALADVQPEMHVAIKLSADKKTVVGIKAKGKKKAGVKKSADAGVKGEVKSVDAAKNTINVAVGKKGKAVEHTYQIGKSANIAIKGNKSASLSDVKPGMHAALTLSDDKKAVAAIKAGAKKEKK